MKNKVAIFLLAFTLMLPFVANPSLAAKNENNGNNGNGKVKVEKVKEEKSKKEKEEKVKKDKVKEEKNKEKKEKNNLSKKVKPEKKEKIKEKIQVKEERKAFKDSEKHWAKDSIDKAKTLGWINGYPDGTFKPEETISNLELITIAMNVVDNLDIDEDIEDEENIEDEEDELDEEDLDDVPGWAKDKVKKAADKKIINLNRFNSHVQVTRAQAAISLAKALELEPVVSTEDSFTDNDLISEEDIGYILALLEEGIITGTPEGKFNPNNSITRGEIATMLANIAEKIVEETEETNEEVEDDSSETSNN